MTGGPDVSFVDAFESGAVAPGEFHHRDHVHLAWCYLQRDGLASALQRFPASLPRFALPAGAPELYHETIPWAYLFVIAERLESGGKALDWPDFAADNPDLFRWPDGVLGQYYSPRLLDSERARRTFVMPDRAPATTPAASNA